MEHTKSDEFTHDPPLMDDSWWLAVMADETKMDSLMQTTEKMMTSTDVKKVRSETSIDWSLVTEILENEKLIDCQVVGYNRGGLIVIGDGFHGFVPISHLIDIPTNQENLDRESTLMSFQDRSLILRVIECDSERGRVILSQRAAQVAPGTREQVLNSIKDGAIVEGEVTNVTKFGAFVDLGGIEGLIHISELSWGRVGHPREVTNTGKRVDVLVLRVDQARERIALSIKRTQPNPWPAVHERYKVGDIVDVEITEIVQFGAFARLEQDLEGLIHISEMGQEGNISPDEVVQKGQKLWARILLLDANKQRISLRLESVE